MTFDSDTEHDGTTEQHERRITRCRQPGCRTRLIFLKTKAGKNMPVEADTVEPDDVEFDPKRHKSHFSDCAGADRFRRPR